jgi:hypothetical protein
MSKLAFRAQTVDIACLPLRQDFLAKNVLMTGQRDFRLCNSLALVNSHLSFPLIVVCGKTTKKTCPSGHACEHHDKASQGCSDGADEYVSVLDMSEDTLGLGIPEFCDSRCTIRWSSGASSNLSFLAL